MDSGRLDWGEELLQNLHERRSWIFDREQNYALAA
jgi:hypothetical protein